MKQSQQTKSGQRMNMLQTASKFKNRGAAAGTLRSIDMESCSLLASKILHCQPKTNRGDYTNRYKQKAFYTRQGSASGSNWDKVTQKKSFRRSLVLKLKETDISKSYYTARSNHGQSMEADVQGIGGKSQSIAHKLEMT